MKRYLLPGIFSLLFVLKCAEEPYVTLNMSIYYSNSSLDSNSFVILFKDTVTKTIEVPSLYYYWVDRSHDFIISYDNNFGQRLMNHVYYLMFCNLPGDTICVDTISFPGGYYYYINFGIHPNKPYKPPCQNCKIIKQDSIIYNFAIIGKDTIAYFHAEDKNTENGF
jgi:hypothetical protein